jgi:xylan 1,4-beta-xylosidase
MIIILPLLLLKRLIGQIYKIFPSTDLDYVEGPHLYKRNGYYYLVTAEGGTGLGHVVTVARSKSLTGPYEVAPNNSVLSSRNDPTLPLQKAGHASIVETQTGEWYMVHLCGRPLPSRGRCIMGRETCIQKIFWNADNWLELVEKITRRWKSRLRIFPNIVFNLSPFETILIAQP